jgi:hypothetical protein
MYLGVMCLAVRRRRGFGYVVRRGKEGRSWGDDFGVVLLWGQAFRITLIMGLLVSVNVSFICCFCELRLYL